MQSICANVANNKKINYTIITKWKNIISKQATWNKGFEILNSLISDRISKDIA